MASERAFESSQPLEKEKPSFSRVLNEITTLAASGTAVSKRKPRPKRNIENFKSDSDESDSSITQKKKKQQCHLKSPSTQLIENINSDGNNDSDKFEETENDVANHRASSDDDDDKEGIVPNKRLRLTSAPVRFFFQETSKGFKCLLYSEDANRGGLSESVYVAPLDC